MKTFPMSRRALHAVPVLLALIALLYGGTATHASEAIQRVAQQPAASHPAGMHVALLLPTGSAAFAEAAQAVLEGFEEGARKQVAAALPVLVYAIADDPQQAIAAYAEAVAAGARLVVGPLTRNGVTALARSNLSVPTLVLNHPDVRGMPQNMYTLSLQVEIEARQVARLALREGHRRTLSVTDHTPLSKRMREAFIEEFERGGGYGIADYAYSTNTNDLERLRKASGLGVADIVFLALDAPRAGTVRPYLGALTVYGTSHLNSGAAVAAGSDLGDVRFVDMPWMVEPDHPGVMVYARPAYNNQELERLYALGIDAARIANALLAGERDIKLDGVTGRLVLGPDRHFQRTLLPSALNAGRLVVLGEGRP
jgi:uncharacterized protein